RTHDEHVRARAAADACRRRRQQGALALRRDRRRLLERSRRRRVRRVTLAVGHWEGGTLVSESSTSTTRRARVERLPLSRRGTIVSCMRRIGRKWLWLVPVVLFAMAYVDRQQAGASTDWRSASREPVGF